MRICIPTQDDRKHEATVCDHFGSAAFFTIYDSETKTYHTVCNSDLGHRHGSCSPMENLRQENIDVVLCKGLGQRALQKLQDEGLRVFQSQGENAQVNVDSFFRNELAEFTIENSCHTHNCQQHHPE